MIPEALRHGGYTWEKPSTAIGTRFGGGRHFVDLVVSSSTNKREILVSLKWQQVSGTAEQKIPFEVMSLADALRTSDGRFRSAYLVLGGNGWSLRDFFVGGGLDTYLKNCEGVAILEMETFISRANRGQL